MKLRRSQQKRITRTCQILRYMRLSKGMSMEDAALCCGISRASINHYEHGRMNLHQARIGQLVIGYGYTMAEYEEYMSGKPIPSLGLKYECINLLDRMDETKLRAVHAVLMSFSSQA